MASSGLPPESQTGVHQADLPVRSAASKIVATAVLAALGAVALLAILNRGGTETRAVSAGAPTASQPVADNAPAADDEPVADSSDVGDERAVDSRDVDGEAMAAEPVVEVAAAQEATPVPAEPTRKYDGPILNEAPPVLGQQQELINLDGWLQTDMESLADLDGTVHIVQFWTFGCYNCKNTLDNLSRIRGIYGGDDFEIVGVHAPEFDYEKDPDAILAAAQDLDVTWPIALDTDKTNFRAWQESRRFWPRTYVIDRDGNIRFDRIGEGAYEQLEATVAWLLEEEV